MSPRSRRLVRLVVVAATAVAGLGGILIHVDDRAPGDALALTPILALLAGVVAFALAVRRLGDEEGPPGSARLHSLPAGFALPAESRPGLRRAFLAGAAATAFYAVLGYSPIVLAGWLASLWLASAALWPARRRVPRRHRLEPVELGFLAAVMLALALLVLPYLATLPYEFSTDEIFSTDTVRDFASGVQRDPLGLVRWWGLPAMYFALAGLAGTVIGTSLEAMRLLTALTAIATIPPMYIWARTLYGRGTATLATLLLAFAHPFIGWGRIALHQNSPLLLLVVALAFLAVGLRDRCPLKVFWGGVVLGLGFYTYPSGQITIVLWAAALAVALLLRHAKWKVVAPVALVSGVGFLLAVAPMLVNVIGSWGVFTARAQAVSMTNPEALVLMGQHLGLQDPSAIIRENVVRAALSFNGSYPYVTYFNPGNGFIDPVLGVLLWLGVGSALTHLRRFGAVLACVGFGGVYAVGFLTEGAPVHGRLLLALPFVTVLAAGALRRIGSALAPGRAGAPARRHLAIAFTAAFVLMNLAIFRNYVIDQVRRAASDTATAVGRGLGYGIEMTNPVGRFFGQEPVWPAGRLAVLVTNDEFPVFRWSDEESWRTWVGFFSDETRVVIVPDVPSFVDENPAFFAAGFWTEAVLMMRREQWEAGRDALLAAYPTLRQTPLTSNRRLVAVHIVR